MSSTLRVSLGAWPLMMSTPWMPLANPPEEGEALPTLTVLGEPAPVSMVVTVAAAVARTLTVSDRVPSFRSSAEMPA